MRILGCALIAIAALLGLAPMAMAGERTEGAPAGTAGALLRPSTDSRGIADSRGGSDNQPQPQSEMSVLAVSLTAGAAVAAVGSGVAQAVTRRRAVSRAPGPGTGDTTGC
ncbi:MAG: hypothetical protein ACRDSN_03745 [Pseudonocardiaceae bacterium]